MINILTWSLLLIFWVPSVLSMYMKWLPNTDLNNAQNWNIGRQPCGNDRMILQDDGPVVFMQMNTTIQALLLPRNGEIVFGSDAILAFTNELDHSATCLGSGSDVTFNASQPKAWLDPLNWCPADTEQGDCKLVPLLDTEKVPCVTSNVIFPIGSSYYVNLGTISNIEVNTLKVSGKAYSTNSFQSFLATDNGRNIFPPPGSGRLPTVTINRRLCTDTTGCGCGNDQGQIQDMVCQIQQPRCKQPQCQTPIRPIGHCCNVCGGMLNVTYGAGFNLNTLKTGLQRNVIDTSDDYKKVQYIVSKCSNGKIQIVLLDDNGVQSSKAATDIRNTITADINNGGMHYAVTKVTVQTSAGNGSPLQPSAHTGAGSSSKSSKGTVAGVTVGVILALLLAAFSGYMVYKKKTSPEDHLGLDMFKDKFSTFKKFNKFNMTPKRKPQVAVPPSVGYNWGSEDSGLSTVCGGTMSQGFDNPIYGDIPFDFSGDHNRPPKPMNRFISNFVKMSSKSMELEMTPTELEAVPDMQSLDDRGFDNPLYDSVHQESILGDHSTEADQPTVMTIGGPGEKNTDTDA